MKEYLENLKNKFNYSDDLINFLEKAIPAIITYYGEDSTKLVLEALSNCEIHIQDKNEDTKQYLYTYWGKMEEFNFPFLACSFYDDGISIKGDTICAKPIVYIKTMYSGEYKPIDFNNDDNLDIILHEILHAIKAYGKIKLKDGKIVTSTGLIQTIYSYDDLGNIKEEIDCYTGIEEAFNVALLVVY